MKKNPYYRLKYLSGTPYLLPFGQGHGDSMPSLRLSKVGVFLWEHLDRISNPKALSRLCEQHFFQFQLQVSESDISQFILFLYRQNILLDESGIVSNIPLSKKLKIAGLYCKLYGAEELFPPAFSSFEITEDFSNDCPHINISLQPNIAIARENGTILLQSSSMIVTETSDNYVLGFPTFRFVTGASISKDGRNAIVYYTRISSDGAFTSDNSANSTQPSEEISHAIRVLFLYFAQLHRLIVIHSTSILYRGKAWLFSAPAGTGKSTHVQLWKDLWNTTILNGDLNLIGTETDLWGNSSTMVYGTPWCGTSGIYDTGTYPLGGIILLKQGHRNELTDFSDAETQLRLLNRCISPAWNPDMQDINLQVIQSAASDHLVCGLTCRADNDAAHCIKAHIDAYLDNN